MLPVIQNAEPPRMPEPAPIYQSVPQPRPLVKDGVATIKLPARIPADCVERSAADYRLNPFVLLAILKVESNGRTGVVGTNKNGTQDIGPAQFNTDSWAARFERDYGISKAALTHDMCQAIRALAFAVRVEVDRVGGDLWRGIGNYHSRTPDKHRDYIMRVSSAHENMLMRGKF